MTATLDHVESELAARVTLVIRDSLGHCWVESGYRDPEHQRQLADAWMHALRRYGTREEAMRHGVTPANTPALSKHCRRPAEAVDVDCIAGFENTRAELFRKRGLHTPIHDELWHAELAPSRSPLTPDQHMEAAMANPSRIAFCRTPEGDGYWVQTADGGVETIETAGHPVAFHGSYPGLKPEYRQGDRQWIPGIQPRGLTNADGYAIMSTAGELFEFHPGMQDLLEK